MGLFKSIGNFFKKIVHGVGRLLGVTPSGAEKRYQRSLLDEQQRAQQQQAQADAEARLKKEQLTALKRSIGAGRKSLLSSWYEEDSGKERSIGS
jgi:stress response protein YsnF